MGQSDFQDQLSELEEIVEWFTSDEADLDSSVEKFERGMELAHNLQSRLKEAEVKITEIKQAFPLQQGEQDLDEEE